MFLPEHREQLLERRRSRREFRMPELDEDWLSEMNRMLSDSLEHSTPVTIVYGSTYDTQQFTGIVRQINPYDGWVRLRYSGGRDSTCGDDSSDFDSNDFDNIDYDNNNDNCSKHSKGTQGDDDGGGEQLQISFRRIVEIREA